MEYTLTVESAAKLQRILNKKLARQLTDQELETAYSNLLAFTFALLDLDNDSSANLFEKN